MLLGVKMVGQSDGVPASSQFTLFSNALSYDRNLEQKLTSEGEISIAILYQEGTSASLMARNDFIKAGKKSSIKVVKDHPITLHLINLDAYESLEKAISGREISAFYITPMQSINLNRIKGIAQKEGILSMTAKSEYFDKGIAIGIDDRGDKPRIAINLRSAKAEQSDFGAQLLKISRVIQ